MNLISWKILTVATLGVAMPWFPANSLTLPPTHSTTYVSQSSQPMFTFKESERVPAIVISADGKKLIGGSRSGSIKIWDLQTSKYFEIQIRGCYVSGYGWDKWTDFGEWRY